MERGSIFTVTNINEIPFTGYGAANGSPLVDYQFALENEEGHRQRRAVILAQILETGECFSVRQLAIDGKDLKELGFSGSQLGACLSYLLDQVIMGKTENTLSALRDAARCQRERQDG